MEPSTARGSLRVYLGAAPGVGKTYAMLDEGHRRADRGTDVVIGFVESYGRPLTERLVAGLPVVSRKKATYRGTEFDEMDLDAVLARHPEVVLVDELAHTNVPGSGRHEKRWQDVEDILAAGIDVITTLNVQHLESLNDVVEAITGVKQQETVPDLFVRTADQVQLVDMTPEALRRRMAHGNVYPPERVDAALGNYFRAGNLTALRELALVWLADSVEAGLKRYREAHGITGIWETRERIVVALTGGPEGDALIRRAARIAARNTGADLLAVHVARNDGLVDAGAAGLESQRLLVESLGGSYHLLVGDDLARTILDFARSVDATQIVLGASRRRPWAVVLGPGTGQTVTRLSGPIDVHIVSHDYAGRGLRLPTPGYGLTRRRRIAGVVAAAVLLLIATPVLALARHTIGLATDLSIYLLIVVVVSVVGGFWAALPAAVAGFLLLNFFFTKPLHTFTISDRENVIALLVFLIIAVVVSRVVDVSAQRLAQAGRASAEAETLSALAGSLLRGEQALDALLSRVQETFGMSSVALLEREGGGRWRQLAAVGPNPPAEPSAADALAEIDESSVLVADGRALNVADQRLLSAFAAEVAVAYRQRELAEAASAVVPLAESERVRTALLNAVSHDLRTPIASAKAAVSGLLASDVQWTEADRTELLKNADDALDRLTDLVTNLLDLSRLQADVLPVLIEPVALDGIVQRAIDHVAGPDAPVEIEIPDELPEVRVDAGLFERVVANLVQNALRYGAGAGPIRVTASAHAGWVELRVVDRGPGIPRAESETVFQPFRRRDDSGNREGVGLGLAIARGFTEAVGGELRADETPGGGTTMVVRLKADQ